MSFNQVKQAYDRWLSHKSGAGDFYTSHVNFDREVYDPRVKSFVEGYVKFFEQYGFTHVGEFVRVKQNGCFENPVSEELTCISARPDGIIICWDVFQAKGADDVERLIIDTLDIQFDPQSSFSGVTCFMFEPDDNLPVTETSLQTQWDEQVQEASCDMDVSTLESFQIPQEWCQLLGPIMKIDHTSAAVLLAQDFPNLTLDRDFYSAQDRGPERFNSEGLTVENLRQSFEENAAAFRKFRIHQNQLRLRQLPAWVQEMVRPDQEPFPALRILR